MKKIKEFVPPNAFSKRCFAQYDEIPHGHSQLISESLSKRNS